MTPAVPRHGDAPDLSGGSDPSFSLPLALCTIARRAGYDIESDHLLAALGLSWTALAVPSEPDLARWLMYARDAFAVEATRLFGITLRPLHPPEAARGLSDAAEFVQHFDASYRPLILRALENNQPVLAWRGWSGSHPTGMTDLMWGIVERSSKKGVGFEGTLFPATIDRFAENATLCRPPVQVYVVETVTPTQPDRDELLDMALSHVGLVLDNKLQERFGVLTGPQAYDAWVQRLSEAQEEESDPARVVREHRHLALSLMAAHESGVRFLRSYVGGAQRKNRAIGEALIPLCESVISCLQASETAAASPETLATAENRQKISEPLARARDTTVGMLSTLR